jgi:hypothetical protein
MLDPENVTRTDVSNRKTSDDGEPTVPCYMFWTGYGTPVPPYYTDVLGRSVAVRFVNRQ